MNLLNVEKEATRLNTQNMKLLATLQEHFGNEVPIFMDGVSEEELPKDNMTYIFIETGNFTMANDKSKAMRETVRINYFHEGRPNPTLDRLKIVNAGIDVGLKIDSTTQDTVILDETNRLIGVFVCDFWRLALKGCG